MRKTFLYILCLSVISSFLFHPVYAESETGDEYSGNSLAQELGLAKEETPGGSFSQEMNSAILLNHLVLCAYEAQTSCHDRLYLEKIFADTLDNINNDALDTETKAEIDQFKSALEPLRMPAEKREKLRLFYQNTQAHALRSVVDDPASLLSHWHKFGLSDLVNAGLYMPADSSESYAAVQSPVQLYYYQDHPSFDEDQMSVLAKARDGLMTYLASYVKAKELPAQFALSAATASDFANLLNSSAQERVQFLSDNAETYSELPDYWALLAESCYETGDYKQCLNAIETYVQKQAHVYQTDRTYGHLIPLAVICLQETVNIAVTRVRQIEPYIERLILNTTKEDWAERYFAAMAYTEITRASDNPWAKEKYLDNAYAILRSVTADLAAEQRDRNAAYLGDAIQLKAPSGASKAEKKEIRDLNILLKEDRKTGLPPVSEALMLSADFLKGLGEKMEIAKEETDAILYPSQSPLFLNPYLESLYGNGNTQPEPPEITFDKKKITVPASAINYDYDLKVTVEHGSDIYIFDDWTVSNVKRVNAKDAGSFIAELTSENNSHMKYQEDMIVHVELIPTALAPCETYSVKYKTVPTKIFFFFNSVKLERID